MGDLLSEYEKIDGKSLLDVHYAVFIFYGTLIKYKEMTDIKKQEEYNEYIFQAEKLLNTVKIKDTEETFNEARRMLLKCIELKLIGKEDLIELFSIKEAAVPEQK